MRNWNNESASHSSKSKTPSPKPSSSEMSEMDSHSLAKASEALDLARIAAGQNKNKYFTSSTDSTLMEQSTATRFDRTATNKLLHKLDLHLIPFLALIYLLCYLDRTNVGNARLVNLEKDLNMKGLDYNIALAVFFPFYVAAEIPSNMMLKRLRPSIWFAIIMVAWSIVMICMGLVHSFSGLIVCRAFLGVAEGGLFPGVTYFITMWYRRHECGFRIALFFSAATAAGAFGGLLARGIAEMEGIGGRAAWSWIFILEGLLTLFVAGFAYFAINDYPTTAKFLTTPERVEVELRLADDHAGSNKFQIKYVYQALRDWKIWVKMVITIGLFTPLYSISLFLPTIINQLGYSANASQLLTVPPYVVACFVTIAGNYAADKSRQRGVFLLGFEALAMVGLLLLVTNGRPHIQYAGTFLAAAGIFPLVPLIGAWTANNIGGSLKRGVGIAMQVGFGNLGGAIAAFVYQSKDGPRFITGHVILIGLVSMSFLLTTFMTFYFRLENSRRDAAFRESGISLEYYTDSMKRDEEERGDDALVFRYTI